MADYSDNDINVPTTSKPMKRHPLIRQDGINMSTDYDSRHQSETEPGVATTGNLSPIPEDNDEANISDMLNMAIGNITVDSSLDEDEDVHDNDCELFKLQEMENTEEIYIASSQSLRPELCIEDDDEINLPLAECTLMEGISQPPKQGRNNQGSQIMLSPGTFNNYKHIVSPVAVYIKGTPQTPMLQNVSPISPIPIMSSSPKLQITFEEKVVKENVHIPQIAYRGAKHTAMVQLDSNKGLPGQRGKIDSIEPVTRKHAYRQKSPTTEPYSIPNDDSISDESEIPQADLSLCIEKSALEHLK